MKNNNHSGFTLSEVLISLTIIGVIAALSVPALLQRTSEAKLQVAYKKAFAQANQAILAAGDDTSPVMMKEKSYAYTSDATEAQIFSDNFEAFKTQFKVIKSCTSANFNECWATTEKFNNAPNTTTAFDKGFVSADGMYWVMWTYTGANVRSGVLVDVNGAKAPNHLGHDVFPLYFVTRGFSFTAPTSQDSGTVAQALPHTIDYTSASASVCPSPPCYYNSWLSD